MTNEMKCMRVYPFEYLNDNKEIKLKISNFKKIKKKSFHFSFSYIVVSFLMIHSFYLSEHQMFKFIRI